MNIPYDRFLWSLLFQLRSNALVRSRPSTIQTNRSEDNSTYSTINLKYMIKELYNKVQSTLWERIILLYHIKCEREITTVALMS
jgi:hypothetical protein